MERLNTEKAELEQRLAADGLYAPERKDELKSALLRQAEVGSRLEELELDWLDIQEQLESIAASA